MAVFGKLDDVLKMRLQGDRIRKGLLYLKEANHNDIFSALETEKGSKIINIEDKNLFAIYSIYNPLNDEPVKFERHKKYIDIQYLFEGEELILVAFDHMQKVTDFSDENDCQIAENSAYSSVYMKQGYVSLLFPEDWHAPGRRANQSDKVKKIVLKVVLE
jgi:YhcH/YjgK/YiaL family protein